MYIQLGPFRPCTSKTRGFEYYSPIRIEYGRVFDHYNYSTANNSNRRIIEMKIVESNVEYNGLCVKPNIRIIEVIRDSPNSKNSNTRQVD